MKFGTVKLIKDSQCCTKTKVKIEIGNFFLSSNRFKKKTSLIIKCKVSWNQLLKVQK